MTINFGTNTAIPCSATVLLSNSVHPLFQVTVSHLLIYLQYSKSLPPSFASTNDTVSYLTVIEASTSKTSDCLSPNIKTTSFSASVHVCSAFSYVTVDELSKSKPRLLFLYWMVSLFAYSKTSLLKLFLLFSSHTLSKRVSPCPNTVLLMLSKQFLPETCPALIAPFTF